MDYLENSLNSIFTLHIQVKPEELVIFFKIIVICKIQNYTKSQLLGYPTHNNSKLKQFYVLILFYSHFTYILSPKIRSNK